MSLISLIYTIDKISTDICHAISVAAKKTIPQGSYKKFKPFWDQDLHAAIKARNLARKAAQKIPLPKTGKIITSVQQK